MSFVLSYFIARTRLNAPGVGGMCINIGSVTVTEVACALILGIIVNLIVNITGRKKNKDKQLDIDDLQAQNAVENKESDNEKL